MTTTFDALQRLIQKYRDVMVFEDYEILRRFIDAIHDIQHGENSHRIDTRIENQIGAFIPLRLNPLEKRFDEWRKGTAT
jgi:hypothetical protein